MLVKPLTLNEDINNIYMWKVITEINERTPLSEKDYAPLNMEIRNHSLQYVEEFINRGPHPQTNSSIV